MKQIFDWMREQLEELLREPWYRHNGDDFYTGIVDAESILDEAEAKWEKVIEQMEEYRAKFDCRTCKYNKTENQVCTKDCTDALIDGMLEILKDKISEVE